MKRRKFIAGLGSAAGWPLLVGAQQPTKLTIGWLDVRPGGPTRENIEGFRRGLAEVGFSEGRDVTVEHHTAEGHPELLPALAVDLVRRRPAAIVASTIPSVLAAKAATQDIPIIFAAANDPVELGLVASLNRPGGNLTGWAIFGPGITEKRLELLHKAVPTAETIGLLVADSPYSQAERRHMESAAHTLGVRLLGFNITTDPDITSVFPMLVEHHAGAILVSSSASVIAKPDQILSHATRFALPTMFLGGAREGGLLSYDPDIIETNRQIGAYTGRILKGEKPAELSVVQPTKFEFVINLKTAKALHLNLPPTLLALTDEVIE